MATAQRTHLSTPAAERPAIEPGADRSLLAFFVLAFALSWALWLVPIFGAAEPTASLAELGALFGPAVAAAVVSWRVAGYVTGPRGSGDGGFPCAGGRSQSESRSRISRRCTSACWWSATML